MIEESINERSYITIAVAREMFGGSTLQCEQVAIKVVYKHVKCGMFVFQCQDKL